MFTARQREVVDLLLAGAEQASIPHRLSITATCYRRHLADIRRRMDVDTHDAMMARLRQLARDPVSMMLEACRERPRKWWTV